MIRWVMFLKIELLAKSYNKLCHAFEEGVLSYVALQGTHKKNAGHKARQVKI